LSQFGFGRDVGNGAQIRAYGTSARSLTAGLLSMTTVVVAAIGLTGCGGSKVDSEPVPECVQYETELASCFHRQTGAASQPSLIPKSKEDRDRIRQTCSENLARLRTACR
jgi:hypothetical protein